MKKILLAFCFSTVVFLSLNVESISADSILANNTGEEVGDLVLEEEQITTNAQTAWRLWQKIGPIDYEGKTKYTTVYKTYFDGTRVCYSGYLGAKNAGGGKWIYEGYLYRCGDTRPIPARIEEAQ